MQSTRYLRRSAMLAKTGLGRTTQYKLERDGQFPARIQLTPRLVVWDEAELDAWLESRRQHPPAAAKSPNVRDRKRNRVCGSKPSTP